MNKKLLFKYALIMIGVLGLVISCQQDEEIEAIEQLQFPKLSGKVIPVQELLDDNNHKLSRKISALSNSLRAKNGSQNTIIIDTTYIEMMQSSEFTNYTFQVVQDSIEKQQVLRNYMITIVDDSIMVQHLVNYPILGDGSYDMDNIDMRQVWGDTLISQTNMKCGGSSIEWYQNTDCYSWTCSPPTGNGQHNPGEECEAAERDRAGTICVTTWASVVIQENPCDSGGSTTPIDPGGFSSGDGNLPPNDPGDTDNSDGGNDDDDEVTATIGVNPNDGLEVEIPDPECQYLKDLLADVIFKSRLNNLIYSAETETKERIHEYTQDLQGNPLPFYEGEGYKQ